MGTQIGSFQSDGWRLNACVHIPEEKPEQRIGVVVLHEKTKFGTHAFMRQVADAFAASGFYALRYENRGSCDSPGDCEVTFEDRVADCCAAAHFFKSEYNLDKVLFWGLCIGASVAVHASASLEGPFRPAGMILCSLFADSVYATLPELNYRPVTVSGYLRKGLAGSPWNRLRSFISDPEYRRNLVQTVFNLAGNHGGNHKLRDLRNQIDRVGPLLSQYDGPSLMVWGDVDPHWASFTQRINRGDRLQLSKMKSPPKIVVLPDGDHGFDSVRQTNEGIRLSLDWATALRDAQNLVGDRGEINAFFASATAN
jgi:dienelactone hydrolase